jgi:Methyltransferase domain
MHEYAAQLRQDDRGPDRAISSLVAEFSHRRLTWWPQLGIGYYPVEAGLAPYDQAYFDAFDRNARTPLGRALMQARLDFVEQHYNGRLVDVGIGSGAFIELRRARRRTTWGYDVNPAAVRWLDERALLVDPYLVSFEAMSLWDVLEHMPDFRPLLANVSEWLFLSVPIFRDAEHALRSKHFKPAEHCWYFTRDGLLFAMKACGFALVSESMMETELGREGIGTFALNRIKVE